jgi:preflagellin peptidase FlaK
MVANQIQYPMVVSAAAVLVTLLYASVLDIRERRVPFGTWYPMLAIGIPSVALFLYLSGSNFGLVVGYLALVATLLYDEFIDRDKRDKRFDYLFLSIVLILPVLSWFVLTKDFTFITVQAYILYLAVFLFIYYYDNMRKPDKKSPIDTEANKQNIQNTTTTLIQKLRQYYFFIIIFIFMFTSFYFGIRGEWGPDFFMLPLLAFFSGIFYLFGLKNFYGGADAWALIFLTLCVPFFPFTPVFGYPPLGFLPFSALVNALLLNLITPIIIYSYNVKMQNKAPFPARFLGFPVQGDEIRKSWGFVMEDFEEKDGVLSRRFIGIREALQRMFTGEGRVYTKDLRLHPERYKKELGLYKRAGTVWISYAVPFIIPITAGLITAIVFGDVLFAFMKLLAGA